MTRFLMSLDEAVELVLFALSMATIKVIVRQ
jgi:FlaA1/EpsC-like NDP-sugar epimerase